MLKNLHLSLFIVPVTVLTLVIGLYLYEEKKTDRKQQFKSLMIRIALLAFVLNLTWELAQGPLYKGYEYDFQHISFCTLASVADVLMVLLLYLGFARMLKEPFWAGFLSGPRIFSLMAVGAVGAVLAEIRHTWEGNWAYADTMPLLPIVQVGLSPVLQFTLLPVIIFGLSYSTLTE
jgi:general stress protein CsbA